MDVTKAETGMHPRGITGVQPPSHSPMPAVKSSDHTMPSKQELLHFLDQHVFNPILHASPKEYSEADQKKLKDVQDRTQSEKERFRTYKSADEVIENFKRDLHSSTAKRVNSELEHLKLPTLPSVKDDFLKVAEG